MREVDDLVDGACAQRGHSHQPNVFLRTWRDGTKSKVGQRVRCLCQYRCRIPEPTVRQLIELALLLGDRALARQPKSQHQRQDGNDDARRYGTCYQLSSSHVRNLGAIAAGSEISFHPPCWAACLQAAILALLRGSRSTESDNRDTPLKETGSRRVSRSGYSAPSAKPAQQSRCDLVLRILHAGVMSVPLVIDVFRMHLDDPAADMTNLRVPSHVIANPEPCCHDRCPWAMQVQ
ncbi:hypothetical protein D8I24_5505 (plasmid) [Cupriavidus necator H850]|nr:hypothetical protein D8I24_5505 [Cupriavidus necator H850]